MSYNKYEYKFPELIRIEPSATCNLSCVHCPTGTYGNPIKGNMSKELFLKIKNEIKNYKIRVVVLYTGGEPFINKDFFFMVKELKEIGIPLIKTVSNGMLLNKEIIQNIIKSNLDEIEFSLDGIDSTMNNFIRKNSSYRKVIDNVKELLEEKLSNNSNLKVSIASTQFKYIDEDGMLRSRRPNWIEKEFIEYLDILNFNYVDAIKWSDMKLDGDIFETITDESDEVTNYCDHISSTITIRSNGDVVPCCYDLISKLVLGNTNTSNLKNIWNNMAYIKLRKSIDEKKFYSIYTSCSVVNKSNYLVLKK